MKRRTKTTTSSGRRFDAEYERQLELMAELLLDIYLADEAHDALTTQTSDRTIKALDDELLREASQPPNNNEHTSA